MPIHALPDPLLVFFFVVSVIAVSAENQDVCKSEMIVLESYHCLFMHIILSSGMPPAP